MTKTDNGIASIVSSKNRYAKALGVDIEDLSVNEVLNLIMETPRILKSPILVDEKRLQVGYKEDDIRAFLPRSVRNVENAEARLRAALINIQRPGGQTPSLILFILFKIKFKPRQHRLAVGMVLTRQFYPHLKQCLS